MSCFHSPNVSSSTADRTRVTDQIRMKYGNCPSLSRMLILTFSLLGMLKEKEAVTDYARMS